MSFLVRGLIAAAIVAVPVLAQAQVAPEAAAAPAAPPLHVYMRNAGSPLTFSARAETDHGTPTWCISPCDARLPVGNYELKLNGVTVDGKLSLRQPGTVHGEYHSRAGARSAAWLSLNVGGIIGGVFITVAALGGPSWAYAAGGGSIAGAGALFVISYRSDRASVSFTPDQPPDVRGMPEPASASAGHSGSASAAERASLGSMPRGVGFRIAF